MLGDGGEQHAGGGHGEVTAVVLADTEDVQARLVGDFGLLDELAHACGRVVVLAGGGVDGEFAEVVDADLEAHVVGSSSVCVVGWMGGVSWSGSGGSDAGWGTIAHSSAQVVSAPRAGSRAAPFSVSA